MGSGQEYPWGPTEDLGLGLMVESPYHLPRGGCFPTQLQLPKVQRGTSWKVPYTHMYTATKNQTVAVAQSKPRRAVLARSVTPWMAASSFSGWSCTGSGQRCTNGSFCRRSSPQAGCLSGGGMSSRGSAAQVLGRGGP